MASQRTLSLSSSVLLTGVWVLLVGAAGSAAPFIVKDGKPTALKFGKLYVK